MPGNEMARRFAARLKSLSGTGPERCRVFINDDVVTLVCDRTLTTAEKSLASAEPEVVNDMREKLQVQVRNQFIPDVEEVTGRKVVAAISSHALEPDVAGHIYILESPTSSHEAQVAGEASDA
jgi:uncharacterized protein YbcI